MPLSTQRILPIALTVIFLACIVVLTMNVRFYVLLIVGDFLWIALASVVIIHLTVRPTLSDVVLVLACAVLYYVVYSYALSLPFQAKAVPAFFGLGSLLILGVRTIWARGAERKLLMWAFFPAMIFVGEGWMTGPILQFTEARQTKVFDLYLYSYECSLRIQPSFLMALAYIKWSWLKTMGLMAYVGLPVPIALSYAQQLKRKGERALPVFLAFFYCGSLGAVLYNVFPAIGPRQLFLGDFPSHPRPIAEAMHMHLEAITMNGTRNAMPSLHMAWALLAWWYSRGTAGWVRAVALIFLVFTAMATMGTGEHFLIDLIVAFPFALFVRACFSFGLSWKNEERAATLAIGMIGTFAWFWLLRFEPGFFWLSPVIPWMLTVVTVVGASMQEWRLGRAEAVGDELALQEDAPKGAGALSFDLDSGREVV
jgi:hypothetical protein